MPVLDLGIHVLSSTHEDADGWDDPGHDVVERAGLQP